LEARNLFGEAERIAARAASASTRRQYASIFRAFGDWLASELGRPPVVGDLDTDAIAAYGRHLAVAGGRGVAAWRTESATRSTATADSQPPPSPGRRGVARPASGASFWAIAIVRTSEPRRLPSWTSCVNPLVRNVRWAGSAGVGTGRRAEPACGRGHIPRNPLATPSRRWRAAQRRG